MVSKEQTDDHFYNDGTSCPLRAQCPIAAAHARLREAHRHWHLADENYSEPDAFRTYVNSCIQALRNVTFVLQKQKNAFTGFESWYSPWQSKLREDQVLRWVVTARNIIVKQGDLETFSVARASILDDYSTPPSINFVVPPLLPSAQIAATFVDNLTIPNDLRQNGIFRLERRWIVQELPDFELLDALAHAHTVLSLLVKDAHKVLAIDRDQSVSATTQSAMRLPCMIRPDIPRQFLISLRDGSQLDVQQLQFPTGDLQTEETRKHYGGLPSAPLVNNEKKGPTKGDLRFFLCNGA